MSVDLQIALAAEAHLFVEVWNLKYFLKIKSLSDNAFYAL
jgi:hypothetical protein